MVSREDAISHLQTIWAWAAIENVRLCDWVKIRHWIADAIELLEKESADDDGLREDAKRIE